MTTHPHTNHEAQPASPEVIHPEAENLTFIAESIAAIDPNSPLDVKTVDRTAVAEFAAELEDREEVVRRFYGWLERAIDCLPEDLAEDVRNYAKTKTLDENGLLPSQTERISEVHDRSGQWEKHASGLFVPASSEEATATSQTARMTPSFEEQVLDDSRTNTFKYSRTGGDTRMSEEGSESMTEQEGLIELFEMLNDYVDSHLAAADPTLRSRVQSLLTSLNFIGEHEYSNGVKEIGEKWKGFLDEDENRQICVPTLISHSQKYKDTKSDEYFKDRILGTFSDEELDKYSGRIVADIADLSAKPEDILFIMADDWSISGKQMERAFAELRTMRFFNKLLAAGSVAVHNLIASSERLEDGLCVSSMLRRKIKLPVYSPFVSRKSPGAETEVGGHIAGTHSVVNYDYADIIRNGPVRLLSKKGRSVILPALVAVVSPYRYTSYEPTVSVEPHKLERRG